MFKYYRALWGMIFVGVFITAFNPVGAFPLTQVDIIADYGPDTRGFDVGEVSVELEEDNLNVIYQTSPTQGHNWILSQAHIWIDTIPATGRGDPRQYPYNSGPINTLSHTFSIPLSELQNRFGITFGDLVYMITYCEIYHDLNDNFRYDCEEPTEIGFGFRLPDAWIGGEPWFAYFWFRLNPPTGTEERGSTNKKSSIAISPGIARRDCRINIKLPFSEDGTGHTATTLEVYNLAGTLRYQTANSRNGTFQLDGRMLVPGLYIIKIGSFTGKLILQD